METLFSEFVSYISTLQQHGFSQVACCFSDVLAQLSFWNHVQNKKSKKMHLINQQILRDKLCLPHLVSEHIW